MYRVKVGHNFKVYVLVKLGAVLLVKLNVNVLCQMLSAGTFALCALFIYNFPWFFAFNIGHFIANKNVFISF